MREIRTTPLAMLQRALTDFREARALKEIVMGIRANVALWWKATGGRRKPRCDPSYMARVNELRTLLTTELADHRIRPGSI